MITIGMPYIRKSNGYSKLCSVIDINEKSHEIFYEVEEKYEKYLCLEKADCFLVGILPYAMSQGLNIRVKGAISEKLYYQIENILIPTLAKYTSNFKKISVDSYLDSTVLSNAGAVGTGLSAGVDSFHTISANLNKETKNFNLTHLTFFNVGSHGEYGGENARELFYDRLKKIKDFAIQYRYELVVVDSNISDVLKMGFVKTHTFRSFSAVLALQKLFGKYYYSSGYTFEDFSFKREATASYDLLNVHCLSNENTSFYSTGAMESRLEKVEEIVSYPPSYKFLNVCMKEGDNCGKCEKCIRTMLELYSINKLSLYSNSFDLKYFHKNIANYLGFMLANQHKSDYKEVAVKMKKNKINIPFKSYLFFIYFLFKENIKKIILNNKFLKKLILSKVK